ncbi:ABC transporter permease [Sulfitobacter pacificus]|uniref:ABC transporter permease n=1 Tax=Sulfitobacter pacificus TaxID=1499314 RepID=UPI00310C166F
MRSQGFQSLPWRFRGLSTSALLLYVYLYIPLIILIFFSFNGGRMATIWEGFSLRWYADVIQSEQFRAAAANSLIVASISASLATALATFAALGFRGRPLRGQGVMVPFLSFPLVVPEIVTAVATLIFFISVGVPLGMIGLVMAHTVFCIPFAFITIKAQMDTMDHTLEQAANDLYADPRRTFFAITLPLLWPAIFAGFILAFIVSLDNFVISLFLAGPSSTTLPIYMYGMMRLGVTPVVNAVSTILLVVSVLFVLIAAWINNLNKK